MIYSPLEQFSIVTIFPLRVGDLFLSFTNSSLYLLIATGLVSLLFYLVTAQGGRLVPSRWQSVVEMTYQFVGSLVEEQIGGEGRKYFPLVLTTFLFLLSTNLVGMIPYSFTATSHLAVTFGLSLSLFIGITIVGFQRHGIHFFSFLLPKGAPLALAPLLVVLELVSYCFRAISLGVRLFANMMAGHTLVKNNKQLRLDNAFVRRNSWSRLCHSCSNRICFNWTGNRRGMPSGICVYHPDLHISK